MLELLQERVTLFSDLAEVTRNQGVTLPNNCRNVFRADTPYAPQAERLLNNAISEGKTQNTECNIMTMPFCKGIVWVKVTFMH